MAVLAGGFPGRNELLVHVQAAFLGAHLLVDDVLDEAVGRTFERHLARLHDVQPALVLLTELLGGLQRLGVEVHVLDVGVRFGALARIDALAHGAALLTDPSAARSRAAPGSRDPWGGIPQPSGRSNA